MPINPAVTVKSIMMRCAAFLSGNVRDHFEVMAFRAVDRADGDRAVERYEASAFARGKS